jgi:AcrR family transcriptional regulator
MATVAQRTSAADTAPSRPQRKDAARNRELLITAAREVFARRGIEASLDDVARHAGVGVGTAYRHFANKYELLSAIMAQSIDDFVAAIESTLDIEDPWAALVAFFEAGLTVQTRDRGLREVLFGLHDAETMTDVQDRLMGPIGTLLRRAKKAGVVRKDLDTSDLGMIVTMICATSDIAGDVHPDLWCRYLDLCLEGLKPGAARFSVSALSEADFRAAMITHKQTLTAPTPPPTR